MTRKKEVEMEARIIVEVVKMQGRVKLVVSEFLEKYVGEDSYYLKLQSKKTFQKQKEDESNTKEAH